ncbi:peroxiredoxin [Multifurca ochricompacta]|uniref:thioredoxin-dependent peroxiredoxin n=1 Tax=Multifurca ochricompacta TaxID=376703 RepID=A0AAD4LY34_9AGAM|nr:peroxiredoxin [Multifurca ochricompacta]KAI0294901.1 peroxiredoxin [Multifurca ochricompacta]
MSPTIQSPAPAFTVTALVDNAFTDVSLSDYLGQWVILMFYPLDFTFVCPTEILAFNDALPEFARLNTRVLAISTDSEYSHYAWSQQARSAGGLGPNLRIPLLADRNMRVARDYGCLIEDKGITFRGSYLIDPEGVLRQITINDLPVGRSVDEALRLIQAFQFTDKYGEVCPANWKEGAKTIRADPTAKLEYFTALSDGAHENGKVNGTKRARVD